MRCVEQGAIAVFLQIQTVNGMTQKLNDSPLILLVTSRRSPNHMWRAITMGQGGAQGCSRTFAGLKAGWQSFLQPKHLRARGKSKAKFGDSR